MSFDPSGFLEAYDALDRALLAKGFPGTSPWWRACLERFMRSGRRRWVLRVGRRGGKSSTLCRVAVAWALWGKWLVPPGDRAFIPFVSVDRDEASARIRTIADILTALGVAFEQRADELELPSKRLVFRVVTCSTRGTVGFTSVACFGDEVARWEARDTSANPAREVLWSLRPTMATIPAAFEVLSSSPWSTDDYHAELFDQADDDYQVANHAPTWEANPTLTEARTRELEPDARTWSREYAAIPGGTLVESWFGSALDLSIDTGQPEPILPWVRYTLAIDPAFASDRFGGAVVSSRALPPDPRNPTRPRRITRVHETFAWKPDCSPSEMARRLKSEVCTRYRVGNDEHSQVFTDQFEGFSFRELARQAGVVVSVVPWTGGDGETSKATRFKSVRMAMLEGALRIPNDADLIRELRSVRGVLLPSGNERIEVPRSAAGHGDRVSALVLAASIVLGWAPQAEPEPIIVHDSPEWHALERIRMREAAVRQSEASRRRSRQRDPLYEIRDRLARERERHG